MMTEKAKDETSAEVAENRPELRAEGQLLQSLVSHWIHEDQLYWRQIDHLFVLELAVLAAFFTLKVTPLCAILMFFAAAIPVRLYFLADAIRRNRDSNLGAIAIISRSVASTEIQNSVKLLIGNDYEEWGILRIARHDLNGWTDRGKRFQITVFGVCVC